MNCLGQGYIHIYTGNGKGKTTAALGLALRAAGWGLKTRMIQFMKGQFYGELESAKLLRCVTIEQFGHPHFCRSTKTPDEADLAMARQAFTRINELLSAPESDILIADEAITAVLFNLISEEDLLGLMARKPYGLELILTGRGATPKLIEAADLVTDMQEIKHYYTKGITARQGVEN